MPQEGKPTDINEQDVENLGVVEFEGERAQLFRRDSDGEGNVRLELETSSRGLRFALYGYFVRGGEFVEVDRERLS